MFSICMLTYNNHDTFKRSLQSMTHLLLDDRVKELLILDNGSHEVSLRNLLRQTEKMYNKVKIFYSGKNLGIAKGRKFLFDACSGDYILSFDSDIVILNAQGLLHILLEAFKNPMFWLIGGGGGNHPYFPTMFRNDINNIKEADEPGKLTLVDEVAGWFNAFRSNMLVKNGGKVYMDERFTPFWGEDSDFSLQVRLLGGKSAIVGKGLVAHRWSSCDKKHVQKTIDHMWEKFIKKWYPKYNGIFDFDFDKDFYQKYYGKEIKDKLLKTDYFLQGMNRGFIADPSFISKLFSITYNNDNIVYKDKEYHPRVFIDKFMNVNKIIENNYKITRDKLYNSKWLVMLQSRKDEYGLEILKKLREHNDNLAVILTHPNENSHFECDEYMEKFFQNHRIAKFVNYYDNTIPCLVSLKHVFDFDFENVLVINSDYQKGSFLENNLTSCLATSYFGEKIKTDKRTLSGIMEVHRFKEELHYYKDANYITTFAKLKEVFFYQGVQKWLHNSLLIPYNYTIHVSPRLAPRFVLERLVSFMLLEEKEEKALMIIECNIDNDMDIKRIGKNNELWKKDLKGDIITFNSGSKTHLKPALLNTDYYYPIRLDNSDDFVVFKEGIRIVELQEYSNIIYVKDNGIVIEKSMVEFLNYSYHTNLSLLEEKDILSLNIFSILVDDIPMFFNMLNKLREIEDKGQEINFNSSIDTNLRKVFGMNSIWKKKEYEENNETIVEYFRDDDKYEPDIDFPLMETNESNF